MLTFWFIAGLIGTVYLQASHFFWYEEIKSYTVSDLLWLIMGIISGPVALFTAVAMLIIEFAMSDWGKNFFEFELWKRKK